MKPKTYAVITGDIIASSKLEKKTRKDLPSLLRKTFSSITSYFPGDVEGSLDVFGGDSWQLAVKNYPKSLRIALAFRLLLKSGKLTLYADTKLSIAVGHVDFLSKNKLSESDGDAFRLSGRNLEDLPKNSSMSFIYPDFNKQVEFSLFFLLLDSIVSRYTDKQSLAVFGKLVNLNQEQISTLWTVPVKQQTISRHLYNADWYAIDKLVDYYEYNL